MIRGLWPIKALRGVYSETDKKKQHKEDGKGCTILVKRGYIRFLDRFCLGFRQGNSVHLDGLAVTPTCVPFLQIDRVCSNADKDTIMQIDAVTLDGVGEAGGIGFSHGLHTLTGGQQQHTHQHKCPLAKFQ